MSYGKRLHDFLWIGANLKAIELRKHPIPFLVLYVTLLECRVVPQRNPPLAGGYGLVLCCTLSRKKTVVVDVR